MRSPETFNGIQVNFCKNPRCANYGRAIEKKASRNDGVKNAYKVAASGKGVPVGLCLECGESFPLKSNIGIHEELSRLVQDLRSDAVEATCPNADCANHHIPISQGRQYYSSFGVTSSGSQRYICKACRKTFSVNTRAVSRQRVAYKNKTVFKLLVNKSPLRRIAEVADIDLKTVYAKIDFIHRQCIAFARSRESRLPQKYFRRLYVSVDRQDYLINWARREDKRNIVLSAVGSAENQTQYVFAMHLNFDPSLDPKEVEADIESTDDNSLPNPYRRYARLWTEADYRASVASSKRSKAGGSLAKTIMETYAASQDRDDIESPDQPTRSQKLPDKGMQVHSEYTLYAHFLYLKDLMAGAEKVRFFMDQDSGMRAACLAAFEERIKTQTVDAFYVSITKQMTVDQKRQAVAAAKKAVKEIMDELGLLKEEDAMLHLLKVRIAQARSFGKWNDRWVFHPLVTMAEPEKALCHLTDLGQYDEDHVAWLYNKASLHGVDAYFNQVRRRLSPLERSIQTSSNAGRVWSGYAPYNPALVQKLLDIHRVFHNFALTSKKDKKTPAMRLGLANAAIGLEEILYFEPDH